MGFRTGMVVLNKNPRVPRRSFKNVQVLFMQPPLQLNNMVNNTQFIGSL